ncbi:hypothetical protein [Ilumatobacter sp.]|uniref:hypothetical protein n=1 Tax=Ilumatobacter sp. TaxID=1967498 RepID=UPI003C354BD7
MDTDRGRASRSETDSGTGRGIDSGRPQRLVGVEGEVLSLVREMLQGGTRPALASLRLLNEVYLPWLERRLVHRARREGCSWTGIGRLLGRSRQAIQQRHAVPVPVGELLPPTIPATLDEVESDARHDLVVELRRRRDADSADASGDLVPW